MNFLEMIADVQKRHQEQKDYVKQTGLCFACKKNPVEKGELRCSSCIEETNKILKSLRGGSGFMEVG